MKAVRLRHGEFEIRLHWRDKSEWFLPIDLEVLGEKLDAAVILNAGYFDENGRPMGYFRSGGKGVQQPRVAPGAQDLPALRSAVRGGAE